MNNLNNHYANLKVLKNAKPFVIDAAYKALLKDLSLSKSPEDQKIKEIIVSSYSVLSDPIQRDAYDKSIQKNAETFEKNQHIDAKNIEKDEGNTNYTSYKAVKTDNLSESKNLFLDNKSIFRKKILITFLAISSVTMIGAVGYLGYSNFSEKTQDVDKKVDNSNESKYEKVDNYNALKKAEIEKANLKQSRREKISAQQEQIDFDDFSQQSESMKKIMQSDVDNIAIIQKNIQNADATMQENIRLNANYEQQEADKFISDEAIRNSEIKNILVEQSQIDRDLLAKEKRAIDLEKQLTDLTKESAILLKQAEILAMHEKSISDIKNKINHIWSGMSNDIDSVFTGVNPQTAAKFRCVIDTTLDYNGKVIDASVSKESSYAIFDDLAKNAVISASPLSVPNDTAMFEKDFQSISFIFSRNSVVLK